MPPKNPAMKAKKDYSNFACILKQLAFRLSGIAYTPQPLTSQNPRLPLYRARFSRFFCVWTCTSSSIDLINFCMSSKPIDVAPSGHPLIRAKARTAFARISTSMSLYQISEESPFAFLVWLLTEQGTPIARRDLVVYAVSLCTQKPHTAFAQAF